MEGIQVRIVAKLMTIEKEKDLVTKEPELTTKFAIKELECEKLHQKEKMELLKRNQVAFNANNTKLMETIMANSLSVEANFYQAHNDTSQTECQVRDHVENLVSITQNHS